MKYVIDISDWNDNIDWSKMKEHCEGVIVKISEGRTLSDLYAKHIASAIAAGLDFGVYCYTHATTTDRAMEEADTVLNALVALGYGKPELGIWFDVEDANTLSLDAEEITAIVSAFISECNSYDYSAGVYASLYTLIDKLNPYDLAGYVPYWCAQYAEECEFANYFNLLIWQGWQYTDKYEIDGNFYGRSEWY